MLHIFNHIRKLSVSVDWVKIVKTFIKYNPRKVYYVDIKQKN